MIFDKKYLYFHNKR